MSTSTINTLPFQEKVEASQKRKMNMRVTSRVSHLQECLWHEESRERIWDLDKENRTSKECRVVESAKLTKQKSWQAKESVQLTKKMGSTKRARRRKFCVKNTCVWTLELRYLRPMTRRRASFFEWVSHSHIDCESVVMMILRRHRESQNKHNKRKQELLFERESERRLLRTYCGKNCLFARTSLSSRGHSRNRISRISAKKREEETNTIHHKKK